FDDGDLALAYDFALFEAVKPQLHGVGDRLVLFIEEDAPQRIGCRARRRQAAKARLQVQCTREIVLEIDRNLLLGLGAHEPASFAVSSGDGRNAKREEAEACPCDGGSVSPSGLGALASSTERRSPCCCSGAARERSGAS